MLGGPEGAVGCLVEMLRVGTALVCSKCWWVLLVVVGVRASESVEDVGVTCTVVGCWLLDAEVGSVGWLLEMVKVGLVVGCARGDGCCGQLEVLGRRGPLG